jgi:hypothetical protein
MQRLHSLIYHGQVFLFKFIFLSKPPYRLVGQSLFDQELKLEFHGTKVTSDAGFAHFR